MHFIGFKLESNIGYPELIDKARLQMDRYSLDSVVANRLQDLDDPDAPRCWLVDSNGSTTEIASLQSLCSKIEEYISVRAVNIRIIQTDLVLGVTWALRERPRGESLQNQISTPGTLQLLRLLIWWIKGIRLREWMCGSPMASRRCLLSMV